jgi:EAL and modified HD-GYP domain-containing signal transduction protein
MLGVDFVSRWATLLALAHNDDCPAGYLEFAIQRARTCELLATGFHASPQECYISGLLSTLDSLLDEPLAGLIDPLPIDDNLKHALLEHSGPLGNLLDCVQSYEAGTGPADPPVDPARMQEAFWEAAGYARRMMSQMTVANKR